MKSSNSKNSTAQSFETYDDVISVWNDPDDYDGLVQIGIENNDYDGEGGHSYTEMALTISQIDGLIDALQALKSAHVDENAEPEDAAIKLMNGIQALVEDVPDYAKSKMLEMVRDLVAQGAIS